MSDDEDSDTFELLMHNTADFCICGRVDACGGLVQNQHLLLLEQSPSKDDQLLLPSRQA